MKRAQVSETDTYIVHKEAGSPEDSFFFGMKNPFSVTNFL